MCASPLSCVPVLLAVGGFSIYHFYLMCRNMTTIESSEKERSATMRRRGQIRHVRFPYDLGWRANIQAVLGDKPLWWCWPQSMQGTGLSYPVSDELSEWLSSHQHLQEHDLVQQPQEALFKPTSSAAEASLQHVQHRVEAAGSFV